LAAYGLLSGKTGPGLLAAAGAAYAYKRYNDSRKNERRYRYYGSPYGGGSFQFPNQNQYNGYSGSPSYQYQNGYAITNDGTAYARRHAGPYTTDEGGNRHYYDPRYGDGVRVYGSHSGGYYGTSSYRGGESYRPGWGHGRKRGWRGHSVPPGQWRHDER
jgi:hypothetical protein